MVQKQKTHDVERSSVVQRKSKQTGRAQNQREQVTHPANVLRPTAAIAPATLRPADILTLQRTVGNRVVQRMLHSANVIQRTEEIDPLKGHSLSRRSSGLPDNLKPGIESLSGMGMGAVRTHYNSARPDVFAEAFAQRPDIHVGPYAEDLIPHEAWHVVQQRQGRIRFLQAKLAVGPANDHYEREADRVAASVMQKSEPSAPQIQRQGLEEEETIQTKSLASSITPLVQRQEVSEEEETPIQTKPLASGTIQRQETRRGRNSGPATQ